MQKKITYKKYASEALLKYNNKSQLNRTLVDNDHKNNEQNLHRVKKAINEILKIINIYSACRTQMDTHTHTYSC